VLLLFDSGCCNDPTSVEGRDAVRIAAVVLVTGGVSPTGTDGPTSITSGDAAKLAAVVLVRSGVLPAGTDGSTSIKGGDAAKLAAVVALSRGGVPPAGTDDPTSIKGGDAAKLAAVVVLSRGGVPPAGIDDPITSAVNLAAVEPLSGDIEVHSVGLERVALVERRVLVGRVVEVWTVVFEPAVSTALPLVPPPRQTAPIVNSINRSIVTPLPGADRCAIEVQQRGIRARVWAGVRTHTDTEGSTRAFVHLMNSAASMKITTKNVKSHTRPHKEFCQKFTSTSLQASALGHHTTPDVAWTTNPTVLGGMHLLHKKVCFEAQN
jgi:hypothetical protein